LIQKQWKLGLASVFYTILNQDISLLATHFHYSFQNASNCLSDQSNVLNVVLNQVAPQQTLKSLLSNQSISKRPKINLSFYNHQDLFHLTLIYLIMGNFTFIYSISDLVTFSHSILELYWVVKLCIPFFFFQRVSTSH